MGRTRPLARPFLVVAYVERTYRFYSRVVPRDQFSKDALGMLEAWDRSTPIDLPTLETARIVFTPMSFLDLDEREAKRALAIFESIFSTFPGGEYHSDEEAKHAPDVCAQDVGEPCDVLHVHRSNNDVEPGCGTRAFLEHVAAWVKKGESAS